MFFFLIKNLFSETLGTEVVLTYKNEIQDLKFPIDPLFTYTNPKVKFFNLYQNFTPKLKKKIFKEKLIQLEEGDYRKCITTLEYFDEDFNEDKRKKYGLMFELFMLKGLNFQLSSILNEFLLKIYKNFNLEMLKSSKYEIQKSFKIKNELIEIINHLRDLRIFNFNPKKIFAYLDIEKFSNLSFKEFFNHWWNIFTEKLDEINQKASKLKNFDFKNELNRFISKIEKISYKVRISESYLNGSKQEFPKIEFCNSIVIKYLASEASCNLSSMVNDAIFNLIYHTENLYSIIWKPIIPKNGLKDPILYKDFLKLIDSGLCLNEIINKLLEKMEKLITLYDRAKIIRSIKEAFFYQNHSNIFELPSIKVHNSNFSIQGDNLVVNQSLIRDIPLKLVFDRINNKGEKLKKKITFITYQELI